MKLCVNLSLIFTEVPLLERFQKAKQAGFDYVEIQFPYEESLDKLIAAKQQADVDVVLINVPAGDLMTGGNGLACVADKVDEFDIALQKCLEYAEGLEVICVNVLSGKCNPDNQTAALATFESNLVKAADALAKIKVITTFEAINTVDMPNFLIHSAEQMWQTIDKLQHPNIKAQYDIYHMAMMGEDLEDDLKNKAENIGHIQFADMPGRAEPGTGTLPFDDIFKWVNDSDYAGVIAAEYKPVGSSEAGMSWLSPFV